jgi:uncharacterized membrane-anchored protein YjiN (DUF445 family)
VAAPERIGRLAVGSLIVAAVFVAAGKLLEWQGGLPFWGGLLAAFGEAALVGGLADWFAVRALFGHPFGIPFPHTALIPRNRQRIVGEIRQLVEKEWLPRSLLVSKVQGFDFVGQAILPAAASLRDHLRDVIRDVLGQVLTAAEPEALARLGAGVVGRAVDARRAADLLADLVRQARERGWLEPVVRELVTRLEGWARTPASRQVIRAHLEQAATAYRHRGFFKDLTLTFAEIVGGVDLDQASEVIQAEIQRFALEQLEASGRLEGWLRQALTDLEQRLRYDAEMLAQIRGLLHDPDLLARLLAPLLASSRDEVLAQLRREDSPWLETGMRHLDAWLAAVAGDPAKREQLNAWCRRLAAGQVEQHHGLVGALVEEQLGRLSEQNLTDLIQERVGEDLNWIRLNGTFVGGLIGAAIYLVVTLVQHFS